jgi:hypothetical protein
MTAVFLSLMLNTNSMKAISLSAQAESFQLTINWKAIATIVSTLARKSLTIVTSEKFALAIATISALASYLFLATDHPLRFALAIIVACIATARVIVPMAKGGEA